MVRAQARMSSPWAAAEYQETKEDGLNNLTKE